MWQINRTRPRLLSARRRIPRWLDRLTRVLGESSGPIRARLGELEDRLESFARGRPRRDDVTIVGLQVANVAGGTVVMEQIFGIPGMGRLLIEAIIQRDYPVIQGLILLFSFTYVFINLIVDILYTAVDPRISHERSDATATG